MLWNFILYLINTINLIGGELFSVFVQVVPVGPPVLKKYPRLMLPFPPCIINATASKSMPGRRSPVDADGCFKAGGTCRVFSIALLGDDCMVVGK